MPCPPSWEDQHRAQLDAQDAKTRASLATRTADLTVLHGALTTLLERVELVPPDAEVDQAFEFVSDLRPGLPLPLYTGPRSRPSDPVPSPEDLRRAEAAVTYRTKLLVRIDLAACVFGCAIARLVTVHGEPEDESDRARIREALHRHRMHRIEERDACIARLEGAVATGAEAAAHAARIARLRSLDDVTLLGDRHVLHRA